MYKPDVDLIVCNKQLNFCVSLIRKESNLFSNLKTGDATDKPFWIKVKSLFSEKVNLQTKIVLMEKEMLQVFPQK